MRPSHLPLPKTTTSTHSSTHSLAPSSGSFHEQSNRKCMVPVAVDRNRRAGSTPTRSMPTNSLIRAGSVRNSKSATSSEKNLASVAKRTRISNSATSQATLTVTTTNKEESNKENNKAKDSKSRIIHQNNNNNNNNNVTTRTKDFVKNNAAAVSRKNSTTSRKSSTSSGGAKANSAAAAAAANSAQIVNGACTSRKDPSSYLRSSHRDQPDLVKVSSPNQKNHQHSELGKLEHVIEGKNRENDQLRTRLKHNAKGFEALALTVDHLGKKLDDWNKLDLSTKLDDLNSQVQSKEAEIVELRRQLSKKGENSEEIVEDEAVTEANSDDKEAIIEHLESRLNIAEEEHEAFIEKLKQDYKSELDLLAESHRLALKALESEHENYLKDHDARHSDILHEVEEKWKQKLAMQLEEKSQDSERQTAEFERQSEKWAEVKRNLEDQFHAVQNELRNQEMAVSAKQKGDLLMKSTQNKLAKVRAEVDSLKAVLEMKTEEIHGLRMEKAKLEDKLEDFDRIKVSHGKVSAHMEDLKAQLNEKQVVERKLSEENRQLYNSMEREVNAKRRLTMEKEELEWKMRSFTTADCPNSSANSGPMSMSMMEGYSGSPFESISPNPLSVSCFQSKGSLTASYSEHCPQSLPPYTGRCRKSRPMSAPPGKFNLASLTKSLKTHQGPDSPRLSQVVEKSESLSWKIEYQQESDQESTSASPLLQRRKQTPPMMMSRSLERPSRRNNESPTALTRSLSRSNSTRKKIIPSFEPLSESTESDSLEEQLQKSKEGRIRNHSGDLDHLEQNKPPAAVSIDDMLDEDIGDISSSSEIEIDEPLGEVTTPQIEALMFPAGAYSSTSSEANLSSPDAEVTIRADLTKVKISVSTPVNSTSATALTSSLPNYDLNKLFSGVQDSGGEGMMAFTPGDDENLILMSATSSELESKPGSEMADSTVSMTSWSTEDFSSSS